MIVRALDSEQDWTFGRGKNDYLKDNYAIAQSIKTRLQSFLGDCFFDLEAGVDWWNLLGSKNLTGLNLSIKSIILNTSGVTTLVELSTSLDNNRNLSVVYSVNTVYSENEPITDTVGIG